MSRTIIIGDVHGCIDELVHLLEVVSVEKKDRLIFIGDLINKGPNSLAVWQLFKELGAESVLGNHELAVLEASKGAGSKQGGIYEQMAREFGEVFEAFLKDIARWPLYIKEKDFLAVHAGKVPKKRLKESSAAELCNIRTWDGKGQNLQNSSNPPWYKCVDYDRPIIFGHWAAKLGVFDVPGFCGLDTGCVYGNELSAVILPEFEVRSVKARKRYCQID